MVLWMLQKPDVKTRCCWTSWEELVTATQIVFEVEVIIVQSYVQYAKVHLKMEIFYCDSDFHSIYFCYLYPYLLTYVRTNYSITF